MCIRSSVKLSAWIFVSAVLAAGFAQTVAAQSLNFSEQSAAPSTAAAPPTTAALLAAAKLADQRTAEQLQTVLARGRIRRIDYIRDLASPSVTLDADVQVYYDAPRFRMQLQYAADRAAGAKLAAEPKLVAGEQPFSDEAQAVQVTEQTLLFDGQTLTTVKYWGDGSCRGDIYFDFHRPNMLRLAGFPFENPVELWREPLQIDRADLINAQTKPLTGGGFLGTLTKDTYRLKFYFLGSFGYDLRRVSSYRIGQETPFRDWHLTWQQTDGVHYVERLVRRSNTVGSENEPLGLTTTLREQVELEYSQFSLPRAIEPETFELTGLGVPEATPFYDHRTNVEGKPKVVWWHQGQLTDKQ